MTRVRRFTHGGLALALAVLMTAGAQASPAAAPSVNLKPTSGPVGTKVSVTGSGFTPNATQARVFWGTSCKDNPNQAPLATIPMQNGSFAGEFTVPAASSGSHSVIVYENGCVQSATASFTVTSTSTTSTTSPSTTSSTRAPTTTTTRAPGSTPAPLPTITTAPTPGSTPPPPPSAPPVLPWPSDLQLIGTPGIGIGTGLFGPSTVLRLDVNGTAVLPETGFVPRCAPPSGATVLDFDDLEPGTDASEAYADRGVRFSADNIAYETRGLLRSADVDETVEVVVPTAGTISEPHALRWTEPGGRQYAHNALEIRFDTPQRVVGMYVGQSVPDGHGLMRLIGGTVDAPQDGYDEVSVSGASAITTCMLLTRADGSPFDTVTLYGYDYSVPELDRLFFSTEPLPGPLPEGPTSAELYFHSPRDGDRYDAAQPLSVTGVVVLRPPVGGFAEGADPIDEVRVTLAGWDRDSFVTREAELTGPSRYRGNIEYRFRVDGMMVAPGTTLIDAVAYGPGVLVRGTVEVEGTGPPVRTLDEYQGLVDIMPFSAEVTQGLRGRIAPAGGAIEEQTIHVADRQTVVRVYGRVDFPGDPDGFDVRRRDIPATAQLVGIRGGRALPGSPLSPTTAVLDVQPVPGVQSELDTMRADRAASWNFVLPDSWTEAGRILLIAVVNPPGSPHHFAEASGAGGLRNWLPISPVRFNEIAPRPVHLVLTQTHWRDGHGEVHRDSPSLGHIADVMSYWHRVFPVPRDGLPIESVWDYPLRFRACSGEDPPGTVCQEPPELRSPPRWDNAIVAAAHSDVIGDNKLRFIPMLFHPDTLVGCGGVAGIGGPPLFHAGACGRTVAQEAGHSLGLDHVSNAHGEAGGGGFHDRFAGDHGEMDDGSMGWDVVLMQPVPPTGGGAHRHDFMSYGDDVAGVQWPSIETWNLLAEAMREADKGAGRVPTADPPRLVTASSDEPVSVLLISGEVAGDRAVLGSGVPAEVRPGVLAAEAELRLEVRDAAGEALAVHRFTPRPRTHYDGVADFTEPAPALDAAAAIVVMRRDTELGRIDASDEPLAADGFEATTADDGGLRFGWEATAGSVYLQARDGDVWRTLAGPFDGGGAEATIERGSLAGLAGDVPLRLAVTDGVRLVLSDASAVAVAPGAPQPVILGLPSSGPLIVGRSVAVRGALLGGDAELGWELDGEDFGSGPLVWLAGLEPGEHTLVLRAVVGDAEAVDERTFVVDTDADGDGLGDAWEIEHGLDPEDPSDRDSDHDGDSLMAWEEQAAGSDPRQLDTDGDDYADAVEVAAGSDPADPNSVPVRLHGDPTAAVPRVSTTPNTPDAAPTWALAVATLVLVGGTAGLVWQRRSRRARSASQPPTASE